MSPQTETKTTPKMKLAVLTVLVLLGAVRGAPSLDDGYQDDGDNQVTETTHEDTATDNHEGLADTNTETVNGDEEELTENSQDGNEEGDENAAEDENSSEDSSNSESESSESSESDESLDEKKKHWFSLHKKHKQSSTKKDGVETKRQKVTKKVNKMVRAQVLKKASNFAGTEVKEDEGGALLKKVGTLVRDAAIRKMAPKLFSKPMHGAVNLVRNHVNTIDPKKQGTMATRDLDMFYERGVAREIGFKTVDRVIDTVSTLLGGALAAGTINKLHKKSNGVNLVLTEEEAKKLAQLAEQEVEQQNHETLTEDQTRDLHSKKEGHKKRKENNKKKEHEEKEGHEKNKHFWSKSKKEELEKDDKHHKKDAHDKKTKHHLWSSSKDKHNKLEDNDDDGDDKHQNKEDPAQSQTHHIH